MAHEGEEGGDGKGFVTVAEDLEVDPVLVEGDAQPCHKRVDGDHEQDSDDAATAKEGQRCYHFLQRLRRYSTHCRCSMGLL